jgi:hypothetical protein
MLPQKYPRVGRPAGTNADSGSGADFPCDADRHLGARLFQGIRTHGSRYLLLPDRARRDSFLLAVQDLGCRAAILISINPGSMVDSQFAPAEALLFVSHSNVARD